MTEIEILQQENDRLKNELRQVKEDHKKQLSDVRRDQALSFLLADFKTEFDDLPAKVKLSALTEITNTRLAADGAELTVDEAGQLQLRRKDGTNFFGEDHNLLTPKSYLDRMLTRDKILKTEEQNNNSGNGTTPAIRTGHRQNNVSTGNWKKNILSSIVEESLKSFAGE